MIPVADLGTFLHGLGLDAAVPVLTPDTLDNAEMPDRAVFMFATVGPGLLLENLLDVPTFQLRFRGDQYDYVSAESLAKLIDDAIVTAPFPATIGGRHVVRFGRTGGGPSYLYRDPAGRSHFTCNYYVEIAVS